MDGTLRLLDTTGNFQPDSHQYYQDDDNDDDDDDDNNNNNKKNNNSNKNNINDDPSPPRAPIEERNNSKNALMEMRDLFDCDSSSSSSSPSTTRSKSKYTKSTSTSSSSSSPLPIERDTRGIIACQIRARGVITSLLMDVAVSQDGLYAFGGVLKGSTELVAVDLTKIELYHDLCSSTQHYNNKNKNTSKLKIDKKKTNSNNSNSKYNSKPKVNVLNLIDVHRHSDAKLKGFGACTRLLRKNDDDRPEYLLFTGKGIKNIHIWSFLPPLKNKKVSSKQTSSSSSSSSLSLSSDEAIWTCLYDTPTNGNTITHLHFRYDTNYVLRAISKSDDQKLRVWDLSPEQHRRQQQCHNNDTGTTTTSTDIHYKKKKEKNDTDDISSSVYVPAPAVTMFSTLVLKRGKDILKRKKSSDHTICNYTNDFDSNNNSQWKRPRRPEYIDVKSTENVLGVFGPYAFSGGAGMNDRMCVTCLDAPDLQCPFNRTEFAVSFFFVTILKNMFQAFFSLFWRKLNVVFYHHLLLYNISYLDSMELMKVTVPHVVVENNVVI